MSKFSDTYKGDLARYNWKPGFYLRIFLYLYRRATISSVPLIRFVYKVLYRIWSDRRGIELAAIDQIDKGLYLGHAYNITINPNAKIGRNCNIHKGVVIGQTNRGRLKGTPTIGNNVWIGVNAVIVGNITIGDDCMIAPNSYVNVSIPPHSVVFGNPCIIKHKDWATEGYINHTI